MPYQNISASLTEAEITRIKASLDTVEKALPFLINLTTTERRKLLKMGDKSLAFVSNCLAVSQSNREILPLNFNVDEFSRDYELAIALSDILIRLRQITEKVDDTLMAVGSEAMTTSLEVYDSVKSGAKRNPGLKTVAEQLGERFKGIKGRRSKSAEMNGDES